MKRNIKYFLSQETKLCSLFKIAPKSFDMNRNLSNFFQPLHFPDEPEIEVDKSWVHGGLGHEVRVLQTAY